MFQYVKANFQKSHIFYGFTVTSFDFQQLYPFGTNSPSPSARVIVVKVDPVKEQLLHDRVVDVGVVSENLEAGEDLEVMKEVRIVLLKAAMHNVYFTSWDVH